MELNITKFDQIRTLLQVATFALTNLLSFKFLLKTILTAKFNFFNSSEFKGKLYLQLEADLDIVFDTLRWKLRIKH